MCGSERTGGPEAVLAQIAGSQHGVVSRPQLLAAGLTERQIDWRLRRGDLHRLFAKVYAVGHAKLSREGRWMAAVLYGGDGAALSHWSAASLLWLRQGVGPRSHVTTGRRRRSREEVNFHYAHLPSDEVAVVDGIPAATPSRTVLDLAPSLPSPSLARMVDAIGPQRGASLRELTDRYPRRSGVPKLRAILARPIAFTRSDLEAEWLARIDAARLPRPRVNSVIEGYEVDFAWPDRGVVAEVDSYATHGSRHAFETDRARDRRLVAAGWRVVRLTEQDPDQALADLSRLLAASAARSTSRRAAA